MADYLINIKVEDTDSSMGHLSDVKLAESEATEVKVKNEPLSEEEEEEEEAENADFLEMNQSFMTVKNEAKETEEENMDALLGNVVLSDELMSLHTNYSVDASVLTKEEDLGMYVEEEKEGSTQVGLDSCASLGHNSVSHCAEGKFLSAKITQRTDELDQNEPQPSAVSFSADSEPIVAESDKKGSLQSHSVAAITAMSFSCAYCTLRFRTKQLFKQHLVIHSKEEPISCPHCPATFKFKTHMKEHLTVHLSKKQYSCPLCSSQFKRKTELSHHLKIHFDERPFPCPHCTAKFKTKDTLLAHSPIHSNKKFFSCSYCSREFKTKRGLLSHSRSHLNEESFSCSYCPFTFKYRTQFMRHFSTIHPFVPHSNDGPFSCTQCQVEFELKSDLNYHLAAFH